LVKHTLEKNGAIGDIRLNASKDNVAITAHGSYVLDMKFPDDFDDQALNTLLNNTPGVMEHGIFYGLTSLVLVADNGKIETLR
jgi:ribose 5-phosphate isomerase A